MRFLIPLLLSLSLPVMASPKYRIKVRNQFGSSKHFQAKHYEADAFQVASNRASSTGNRHRLDSDDGHLLDLVDP